MRMARPRRDAEGPGAVERMTEAFWRMLEKMPYADIKVLALAREADVSPNTLYYHFGGVADIARHALEAELDEGLVSELLVGAPIALDSGRARRMERVVLAARSGSAELTGMLAASLRALWLESAGVAEDDLDDAQRADLAFMFGGLVAMLGDEMLPIDVGQMAAFASRPLGAGAVATMIALEGAGSARATNS